MAIKKESADLITDIVGHPKGLPSVEELVYMNPSLEASRIRSRLNALVSSGILCERSFKYGVRDSDHPNKFYELTDEARDLFDQCGLFPEAALRRQYQAVEKTDRVRALESLPRPDS